MMALPKFTKTDGTDAYIWEEGSDLPGDRYDLSMNMRQTNHGMEHKRHGVVYARSIFTTMADYTFVWKNISRTMISAISVFYTLASFRYYPDSDGGSYKTVFIIGNFAPKSKRGGTFDLTITLKEI